jgi:hypothetical protein
VQGNGEKYEYTGCFMERTERNYTGCFVERTGENNHLEDVRIQVRIILKLILKKYYGNTLKGLIH